MLMMLDAVHKIIKSQSIVKLITICNTWKNIFPENELMASEKQTFAAKLKQTDNWENVNKQNNEKWFEETVKSLVMTYLPTRLDNWNRQKDGEIALIF